MHCIAHTEFLVKFFNLGGDEFSFFGKVATVRDDAFAIVAEQLRRLGPTGTRRLSSSRILELALWCRSFARHHFLRFHSRFVRVDERIANLQHDMNG